MTTKALIMVRSGSQRVKNKNLKPFSGSSLLELKINQLKQVKELDGIIVNSNDDAMLDIAKGLGCETVKRDDYYATDSINNHELYENVAKNLPEADIIVYAPVTSPLIANETISQAINTFKKQLNNYDSLTTISVIKEFLYKGGMPLNFNPKNRPRSQDLPDEFFILNHALYIIKKEDMIAKKNILGDKPYFLPISKEEAADIDDEIDFGFAEFLYKKMYGVKL